MNSCNSMEVRVNNVEKQLIKLDGKVDENGRVIRSVENNIDKINEQIEDITSINNSVMRVTFRMDEISEKLVEHLELFDRQNQRLEENEKQIRAIKSIPGEIAIKTWKYMIGIVVTAVISLCIGALF